MSHNPEEIKKHVRVYVLVFLALAVLTGLTVAVSYFHLPVFWAIAVALAIAAFKGSLVAAYFMHLSTEKKIIFAILLLAALNFLAILIFPAISRF